MAMPRQQRTSVGLSRLCSPKAVTSPASCTATSRTPGLHWEVLAAHWQGPKMAYAETGSFVPPTWVFEEAASPEVYAEAVVGWVEDHGVQIVGGCCGTGPNHIAALRDRLA